jgi:CDP-glucose 4,6-dehydratase
MTEFWTGKTVLVTGHTGFKGSWLSLWLEELGAQVAGFALAPKMEINLFDQLGLSDRIDHHIGDIRDASAVAARVADVQPDVVFHLAAQSLVLEGYESPVETWQTNVMGTAHLIEALRKQDKRCAAVMVTTDKVYENREDGRAYREDDALGGHDPYSASKAGMEIAISSWRRSFLGDTDIRMASARAGNVIGGGDWAENRIVPDIARALGARARIGVRNPNSVRPWQHVLEPLSGYMTLAERLWQSDDPALQSSFNFGPSPQEVRPVRDLVLNALTHWPGDWSDTSQPNARHEAGLLSLDPKKARDILGVTPRWSFEKAVEQTINWYKSVHGGTDPLQLSIRQIAGFCAA